MRLHPATMRTGPVWILTAMLALSGCTHAWDADGGAAYYAQQQAAQDAQEQQQLDQGAANIRATCTAMGAPPGSPGYAPCVMNLFQPLWNYWGSIQPPTVVVTP